MSYENIDSWFWDDEEIKANCKGCKKESDSASSKFTFNNGIYTGLFCEKCYDNPEIYTYRKDEYFDEAYAGERLEEDY